MREQTYVQWTIIILSAHFCSVCVFVHFSVYKNGECDVMCVCVLYIDLVLAIVDEYELDIHIGMNP